MSQKTEVKQDPLGTGASYIQRPQFCSRQPSAHLSTKRQEIGNSTHTSPPYLQGRSWFRGQDPGTQRP